MKIINKWEDCETTIKEISNFKEDLMGKRQEQLAEIKE